MGRRVSSSSPAERVPERPRAEVAARAALVLACAGQFLVTLDLSIVNVALPAMRDALGLSEAGQLWVVNAYTLPFAGLLLLGGRLADLLGIRRTLAGGVALFTLASIAGSAAANGFLLVAARAAQGVGAALLAPAALALVLATFPEQGARRRALAKWSAVSAAAGAGGAVLGGLLSQYLGWRSVLLVNAPVGIALCVGALVVLPARQSAARPLRRSPRRPLRRPDLLGGATITGALTLAAAALIDVGPHGWGSSDVVIPASCAAALFAAFGVVERFAADPIVPAALLSRRTAVALGIVGALGAAMLGLWYLLSLDLQQVAGLGAARTGAAFLPGSLAVIVGAQLAGRLADRFDLAGLLIAGTATATVGLAWLARPVAAMSVSGLMPALVLAAFGLGFSGMPATAAATAVAAGRPDLAGAISGLANTARQFGGALGIALTGAAAAHRTHPLATAPPPGTVRAVGHAVLAAGYSRGLIVDSLTAAAGTVGAIVLVSTRRSRRPITGPVARRRNSSRGEAR